MINMVESFKERMDGRTRIIEEQSRYKDLMNTPKLREHPEPAKGIRARN